MTTALFPSQALKWLETHIAPLTRNTKRLAFRCALDDGNYIVVANAAGKSAPDYTLQEDDGGETIMVNNNPVRIRVAPEGVKQFEALMQGIEQDDSFSEEESSMNADSPTSAVVMEPGIHFNPTPHSIALPPMEPPQPISCPTLAVPKQRRTRTSTPKADRVPDTSTAREKMITKMCRELKVRVRPVNEMYQQVMCKPGVTLVPFKELAVANHPAALMHPGKSEIGKAMAELVAAHNEANVRNILNLSSEVDPKRVVVLAAMLLRVGRLTRELNVCQITDDVPRSATLDVTNTQVEEFDATALQVYAGRHRAMALALIYGEDVLIPVTTQELTYMEAAENCVFDNMVRDIGKQEQIHYDALMREMTIGSDPKDQFASLGGKAKAIASFVANLTIVDQESTLFYRPTQIRVADKRSPKNVTTAFYRSAIEFALNAAGLGMATELNVQTIAGISMIVEALDKLFGKFERIFRLDAERKLLWTYYAAGAYGYLLGDYLNAYIKGLQQGDGAELAAEYVSNLVTRFFSQRDDAKSVLAKQPPAVLKGILRSYDAHAEHEDGEDAIDPGLFE